MQLRVDDFQIRSRWYSMNQEKIKILWNMPLHRYAESFEYSIEVEINILRNDNVSFLEICCLKVHKRENFLGFDFEICTFS